MIVSNDSVQFESRRELEALMVVLNEYFEQHDGKDFESECAEELQLCLETLNMCW